ncbi:MAG: C4-type zinc ribbon domain-containing protein [Thermodesulfobacteriota bacterium]|nr:C4-type zinc ribbon domain-containing protein [Thermodesulfobacteriota bacterium]
MREQIDMLVKLQDLDLDIERIEEAKETYPQRIAMLRKKLEKKNEITELNRTQIADLEKLRLKEENIFENEINNIKKSEEKLLSVKTNKEYQAVLKEIEIAKGSNSEKEETILSILEEIDIQKRELKEKEEELKKAHNDYEEEKNGLLEKMKEFEKQLSEKIKTKEILHSKIDTELFKKYKSIKNHRQGIAVVRAKNGFCQGCNMDIPPQLYNEVQKGTDMVFCQNCNRILYWRDNDAPQK